MAPRYRSVRLTTSIINSFISSPFKRDSLFQGISPYGVTTLTSEKSPVFDDGDFPVCSSSSFELRKHLSKRLVGRVIYEI
jgi:hypothetical protein